MEMKGDFPSIEKFFEDYIPEEHSEDQTRFPSLMTQSVSRATLRTPTRDPGERQR